MNTVVPTTGDSGALPALRPRLPSAKLTIEEQLRLAEALSYSPLIPAQYVGSRERKFDAKQITANLFLAINLGQEVGLSPIQAIQSVTVINNRTALYSDGLLAVVMGSGELQDITESIDNAAKSAICTVIRKGRSPVVRSYSWEQATRAGLVERNPVYKQFPERMLQMRARSYALRDAFADILKGLRQAEIEIEDQTPAPAQPLASLATIEAPQPGNGQRQEGEATAESFPPVKVEGMADSLGPYYELHTLPTDAKGGSDFKAYYQIISDLLDAGSPAERKALMETNRDGLARLKAAAPVLHEMLEEKANSLV